MRKYTARDALSLFFFGWRFYSAMMALIVPFGIFLVGPAFTYLRYGVYVAPTFADVWIAVKLIVFVSLVPAVVMTIATLFATKDEP